VPRARICPGGTGFRHPQPDLSWWRVKRRNSTGSSRMPSRFAHRARPIRQYPADATSSRLLPPSPPTRGSTDTSEPSCHGRHRHRPDPRNRPCLPRWPGRPAVLPGGRGRSSRLFHDPRDFLAGDRQPRGLLLRPCQVLRKLLDPDAQPVRLGPRSILPPAEFLDQRAHPGLLPLNTALEDQPADQLAIQQSCWPEPHPYRIGCSRDTG
jgi:hypothetical protein